MHPNITTDPLAGATRVAMLCMGAPDASSRTSAGGGGNCCAGIISVQLSGRKEPSVPGLQSEMDSAMIGVELLVSRLVTDSASGWHPVSHSASEDFITSPAALAPQWVS